ncbi:UNVERIFIED_CONTAM: hypothetical protein Slati_3127000 [Sesamum latifolium]|uniref:Uncharacterized protein n=1 Tax=Sesamum latifolium TaxID=2727402 RepID=A0AAW2UV88_9LAMI
MLYERCPKYCTHYRHFGHGLEDCREGNDKLNTLVDPPLEDLRVLLNKKRGKVVVKEKETPRRPPLNDLDTNAGALDDPTQQLDEDGPLIANPRAYENIADDEDTGRSDSTPSLETI